MDEQARIEEEFRKIGSKTIENSFMRINVAEEYLTSPSKIQEYSEEGRYNIAGESFAFSIELALKANMLYDDFRRSLAFSSPIKQKLTIGGKSVEVPPIGSKEWYQSLAGNEKKLKYIGSPKLILDLLTDNNLEDLRLVKLKSEQKDSHFEFAWGAKDKSKPSGHDLYLYYQLQNPVVRTLIDTEFFCYIDGEIKETIYALLTDDIIKRNVDGMTIMPEQLIQRLDAVKESSVELRYASISFDNVDKKSLLFLKEFSASAVSVGEYRFPLPKRYEQIDFNEFSYDNFFQKGYSWFSKLDKMSRYYLQRNFTQKEIIALQQYIDNILIGLQKTSELDVTIFLNTCVYFKNYVREKLQINLEFTDVQYQRIADFCVSIKYFQPFKAGSKKLCEYPTFIAKRNFYRKAIEKKQAEMKDELATSLVYNVYNDSKNPQLSEEQNIPLQDVDLKKTNVELDIKMIKDAIQTYRVGKKLGKGNNDSYDNKNLALPNSDFSSRHSLDNFYNISSNLDVQENDEFLSPKNISEEVAEPIKSDNLNPFNSQQEPRDFGNRTISDSFSEEFERDTKYMMSPSIPLEISREELGFTEYMVDPRKPTLPFDVSGKEPGVNFPLESERSPFGALSRDISMSDKGYRKFEERLSFQRYVSDDLAPQMDDAHKRIRNLCLGDIYKLSPKSLEKTFDEGQAREDRGLRL